MTTMQRSGLVAALLVACGGTLAHAQQSTRESQRNVQDRTQHGTRKEQRATGTQQTGRRESGPMKLCYFTQLKGMNVKGHDNDTVCEIKDVIFDRHSGDIAGYVVSDDRVIAPAELTATLDEDGKVEMRTALTKDALRGRMEFDSDAFDTRAAESSEVAAWWSRFAAESNKQVRHEGGTYHAEKIKSTERTEVNGVIDSMDRVRGEGDIYRTVATIRDENGTSRTVILGPTWYLADAKALPTRGQRVKILAAPLDGEDERWAASTIQIEGGGTVTLREGDALNPVWYKKGDASAAMSVQRRMLLASSIKGDDVKCREESSGEVENLAIDVANARVVALVIDPNENFMGAADTLRLIPVSVASPSSDDLVYVDAEKEMIINAPAAPTNLAEMNNAWKLDAMFKQRPIANR